MAAKVLQIADAVVAVLNAGTFSPDFTATRRLLPLATAALAELAVTVRPGPVATELASRSQNQSDYRIEVAVEQSVDAAESDADALIALAEAIETHLDRRHLTVAAGEAKWLGSELVPYDPETLRARVLVALVTVTYRLYTV